MKQTINECQFRDAFKTMGRAEQFSYGGLGALYDLLTELEQDCDLEIELDVIALCCEYSENKIEAVLKDYDLENLAELQDRTMAVQLGSDVLYQVF